MDILLIVITVVIIMGIAFILSRPFAHPKPATETAGKTQDYLHQYENLLREIKILQDECENLDGQDEACSQIEVKKHQAANLLRLIDTPLAENALLYPIKEPSDPEEAQPESLFLMDNTTICPQCGRRVASSDKFCTQCGNRLQP
jgi:hypothetical protein